MSLARAERKGQTLEVTVYQEDINGDCVNTQNKELFQQVHLDITLEMKLFHEHFLNYVFLYEGIIFE